MEDEQDSQTEEVPEPTREAAVARTSSGRDHHNTLTPHWDFDFSV